MTLLIGFSVMGSVLALFLGIYFTLGPDNDLEERLALDDVLSANSKTKGNAFKQRVNAQITRGRWGAGLNVSLFQAGSPLTAVEFLAINLALVVFLFLFGWMMGRNILPGIGLAIVAAIAPWFWLKRQKTRRLTSFQQQLPDVLSLLVGSLRSGYGLMQALRMVAQEMPSPSSEEYERVTQEIAFGVPMIQALGRLVERMESEDLEMVVAAIQVQHEVGGNLGEILATIAETIRERIEIQGEIRSITGMQRATGYLLACMPFILAVILLVLNPKYMMPIFTFPWVFILIFAACSVLIGLLLISKMINSIEV